MQLIALNLDQRPTHPSMPPLPVEIPQVTRTHFTNRRLRPVDIVQRLFELRPQLTELMPGDTALSFEMPLVPARVEIRGEELDHLLIDLVLHAREAFRGAALILIEVQVDDHAIHVLLKGGRDQQRSQVVLVRAPERRRR